MSCSLSNSLASNKNIVGRERERDYHGEHEDRKSTDVELHCDTSMIWARERVVGRVMMGY